MRNPPVASSFRMDRSIPTPPPSQGWSAVMIGSCERPFRPSDGGRHVPRRVNLGVVPQTDAGAGRTWSASLPRECAESKARTRTARTRSALESVRRPTMRPESCLTRPRPGGVEREGTPVLIRRCRAGAALLVASAIAAALLTACGGRVRVQAQRQRPRPGRQLPAGPRVAVRHAHTHAVVLTASSR